MENAILKFKIAVAPLVVIFTTWKYFPAILYGQFIHYFF